MFDQKDQWMLKAKERALKDFPLPPEWLNEVHDEHAHSYREVFCANEYDLLRCDLCGNLHRTKCIYSLRKTFSTQKVFYI